MSKNLVIVESPAKARTINQYLGSDYVVKASFGHIRDLPKTKLGIEPEHDFAVQYQAIPRAKSVIKELQTELSTADALYLAPDPDREGEAIAWHLVAQLKPKVPVHRISFHEITKPAIEAAIKNPRDISINLVDAQQARRILDRLVGYKLSPFLWKKVYRGLSAGRVQSVAVRLIVEREREIKAHKVREFWTIEAVMKTKDGLAHRSPRLAEAVGEAQAGEGGEFKAYLADSKTAVKAEFGSDAEAQKVVHQIQKASLTVTSLEVTQSQIKPSAPLITSTLQQAAARALNFSAKRTMKIAQDLYEGIDIGGKGTVALITYMRTDSYQMSQTAKKAGNELIAKNYGAKYLPETANVFGRKVKGAQEAHEAIRPTDFTIKPEDIKDKVNRDYYGLYKLIWQSALSSLMSPSIVESTTAVIDGATKNRLIARGRKLLFDGHLKLNANNDERFEALPKLTKGEGVKVKQILPEQHFTEPPARYSEASLVKELEKRGIGRPSTYALIMSTIVDRGYVLRQTGRFVPQSVAEVVTDLLVENFPKIVDYDFTAEMEDDLDDIAEGSKKMVPVLHAFYDPFAALLEEKTKTVKKSEITEEATDQKCPKCAKPVVIKLGRFGKFYSCTGFPECKYTAPYLDDKFNKEEEKELAQEVKGKCEKCGGELVLKQSRFGTFIGCANYPKCKFTKSIIIGSGVKCPDCGKEIIRRSSRRGKVFWGCSGYPKCKKAFWDEPLNEKCPDCGNLLINKKSGIACSQCDFTKEEKVSSTK